LLLFQRQYNGVDSNNGTPNLLIDTLEVNQSVGNVLGVAYVIHRNLQIASSALKDTIDEIGQGRRVIRSVFV
jgi:hypothetical protein